MIEREVMGYDVLVVGAGPAGLAAAIRLKQLDAERTVCVLEKASEVGGHAFSGAVMEPGPLDALLPGWREKMPPTCVPATRDEFRLLTRNGSLRLPVPPQQHNAGNFIISLGELTAQLAQAAEALGVDVLPGFAAASALFDSAGAVAGVRVGDVGLDADGNPGPDSRRTGNPCAPTLIAEGCRGSLAKTLIARYRLDADRSPQTFALGFKELCSCPRAADRADPAFPGWPLESSEYGGSFVYHLADNRLYVGYVVGLDTRIRNSRRSRRSSNSSTTPRSVRCLRAASSLPMARARLLRVAGNPVRSSTCRGRCWSAMPAAR